MTAPDPRCTAVAAAMKKSGLTYAQIATKIGRDEQHVIDDHNILIPLYLRSPLLGFIASSFSFPARVAMVCTGSCRPTAAEFDALAGALNITSPTAFARPQSTLEIVRRNLETNFTGYIRKCNPTKDKTTNLIQWFLERPENERNNGTKSAAESKKSWYQK
ncbi:hypothetical protein FISHEDRAFT_54865 [Fistulina hepatica ATCC 64428]|uniref:Uncharacterized protein n=1 Tax=Fistulina hepatica ATCC 64428 TaxID=1128425 RepID=A0A0D7AQQ7_9AGAR|nr:hypothetical protein FISHEDRAFT_54865 [Fistulina hepatica ATCC 64428]